MIGIGAGTVESSFGILRRLLPEACSLQRPRSRWPLARPLWEHLHHLSGGHRARAQVSEHVSYIVSLAQINPCATQNGVGDHDVEVELR
jgi:hypothetical protein